MMKRVRIRKEGGRGLKKKIKYRTKNEKNDRRETI
jgi:hypothetical protein